MRKEAETAPRPGQAVLIVTYGNTTQKCRPLDGDLVVLGRAPTCDIALVSPEVASVHCILQRTREGWWLRDCSGGRRATRLNGRPVHEEALHDHDVLQIGAFSFEVRLPASRPTPTPGSTPAADARTAAHVKRLQRSRRNLARLALQYRQRAQQASVLPPTLAELERQAQCLRDLQRDYEALVKDYEARLADLEKAEHEVCDERTALEQECNDRRTQLDRAEHEMARQRAEMETLLKQRWEECEQRCRQAEEAHTRFLHALPDQAAAAAASQEWAVLLDRRSHELNHFARYLRRLRLQQAALAERPAEEGPVSSESAKREAEWASREVELQQHCDEWKAEHDRTRVEAETLAARVQELQVITESLQREIRDRDAALQQMRRQLEQQATQVNLEHSGSYERELNAYRLELERDRRELNEQLYQLQARQADMEAAAREAELQMSRERAVIARERAELTRMRDEIRIAKDRTSREGGVRERLAQLHSLKQQLTGTSSSAPGEQLRPSTDRITEDCPAR